MPFAVARIGCVWYPQVTAQHVDAGVAVLFPVISQPCHGIDAGQPDGGWLVHPQHVRRRDEPFVHGPDMLLLKSPV